MAQGIAFCVGIAEGYITEFHEIFIVVPFLHSEGALVHGVGDVQVGEIPL